MTIARFLVALLGVLALPAAAFAQPHETMPIGVQSDRVTIGAEYVRRCIDLPQKLVVPAGQTATLPADSTWDCIEVAGTLVAPPGPMTVRFTHFLILPGGAFEDRAACGVSHTLIARNVPIDPARDPFQWGNGLLNFGKQTRIGCAKTAFTEITGSVAKGSTTLTLAVVPTNWAVGDELLLPDMDKPLVTGDGLRNTVSIRREATVTIAALSGALVTLSKPLDFEHAAITDPQGRSVLRPRVANLTRNLKIQSENAATPQGGVRGHTADIGMGATWEIRANEFVQLGRTLNAPLNDFVAATAQPGTNQRGKYAEHHHHVGSCPTCVDEGNVYRGHPLTTKWALAVHATSDVLVKDNVGVDFPGAIFVTEDGYEVRNVFTHNLAAYSMGIPGAEIGTPDALHITQNCPGCGGAGFWFRGVANGFTGNEAIGNFRGIDLFNQNGVTGTYPSAPGLMPDTPYLADITNHTLVPRVFADNVAASNVSSGLEIWAVHTFPNERFIGAYNGAQVDGVISDGIDHFMITPTLVCKPETNSTGITAGQAYSNDFRIERGGYIGGCAIGIHGGGGKSGLFLLGPEVLTLQNDVNIDLIPEHAARFVNVLHVPLGSHPHQYLTFSRVGRFSGMVWQRDEALPDAGVSMFFNQAGSPWQIENWQGTGENYRLLHTQSRAANPAWYSGPLIHAMNTPALGLTMQQSWDTYGIAWGGDVLTDADLVNLDGIVNGYGRRGFGVALSPPRAVVTFPTLRQPAITFGEPTDPYLFIGALATGDLTQASDAFYYQIDDRPAVNARDRADGWTQNVRAFNVQGVGSGLHTIKVWLTQKANPAVPLAGSESTSSFCVGPTCQTTVPAVKGLPMAYAANAVLSAQLTLGATTQVASSVVPVGGVVGTVPAAGTSVPQQSVVGVVISLGDGGTPPPPPTTVAVPNVIGLTEGAAASSLGVSNLVLGVVTTATNAASVGQVLLETPAAGTVVPIGSVVTLTVSSGPAPLPTTVAVPNVVGKFRSVASTDLVAAQLTVGRVTGSANTAPQGLVLTQTPAAGTVVEIGRAVDLVVSTGTTGSWVTMSATVQRFGTEDRYRICPTGQPVSACFEVQKKP
jgi:beta-lactam-binding protein with PASTA domain